MSKWRGPVDSRGLPIHRAEDHKNGTSGTGAIVLATSPTLTAPTITDVNASTGARGQIMVLDASAGGTSGIAWCNPFYAMAREIIRSSRHRLGWYKAGFLNLSDGAAVTSWTDLSGVGNDMSQATSSEQPTFKTNIINGKPVVRFAGDDFFDMPNMFSGVTGAEAFVVIKIDNDPPADVASGLWEIGDAPYDTHYPWTSGTIYDSFASNAQNTVANPSPSLSSAFRVYNSVGRSGETTQRLDGVQLATSASNTVAFVSAPTFGRSKTSTFFLDGDVAELIFLDVSDAALATSLRDIITAYLMFEYGL